jgi:uncharacterized damage-inducible protein DinB
MGVPLQGRFPSPGKPRSIHPVGYHGGMDRRELAAWWNEADEVGVWWAPWREAVEELTAQEAAWQPAPGRHAIWEIVNHVIHWREYFAYRNEGGAPLREADVARRNWPPLADVTEDAWQATRVRFAASHAHIRALLENPAPSPPPKPELDLRYLLLHDSYHMGQIMYLRGLLGKDPLEA